MCTKEKKKVYYTLPPNLYRVLHIALSSSNRAIYLPCLIVTCNVHFLSNGVTFLDGRRLCSPYDRGRKGHFILKPLKPPSPPPSIVSWNFPRIPT